jgi:hypothetical protein
MQDFGSTPEPLADWDRIRQVLDDAIEDLSDQHRDALLLRYFKNEDLRSVGAALCISDDAAQKRITRALEKLRTSLIRRGVTTTAAALSAALSVNAVQNAPTCLAATLASASLAGAKIGTIPTLTLLKFMTMTKAKLAVTGAILAAGIATTILLQQKTNAKLRLEIDGLRQETQELAKLREDYQHLARLKAEGDAREQNLARALRELQTLYSAPKTNAAVLDAPKSDVANETPNMPFVPAANWANVGIATWADAVQTSFWARARKDTNIFANTVVWDPDVKSKLEALLAVAPNSVRQRLGSVDEVLYDWWFNDQPPAAGYRVTNQRVDGDICNLIVECEDEGGRTVMAINFLVHSENDGWRLVFTGDMFGNLAGYLSRLGASN